MQQKQHANDTAKNAKDKSDKEVNTLQKLHHKAKSKDTDNQSNKEAKHHKQQIHITSTLNCDS
jgi:hypothetical protein